MNICYLLTKCYLKNRVNEIFMWGIPLLGERDSAMVLFAIAILSIIIITQISAATDNETEEDTYLSDGGASNLTAGESSAADESMEEREFTVHVYVTNNDNERLKVSLFIDSELIDNKEIASDSEEKIDSYPLSPGPHSFKITWWDEDIRQSLEMEETRDISAETSVNLYTTLHDEPDVYEITVNLVNENPHDLEAFLYADGSFEKSKDAKKESSTELGSVKLEEGPHNLSVRWQDPETKIEYEKTRKITVRQDEAVILYAPRGVSFQSTGSISSSDDGGEKDSDKSKKDQIVASNREEDISSNSTDLEDEKNTSHIKYNKDEPAEVKDAAESDPGQSSSKSSIASRSSQDSSSEGLFSWRNSGSPLGGSLEDSNKLYIYALLVILAVYLIQRR